MDRLREEKMAFFYGMAWKIELASIAALFALFLFVNVMTSTLYPGVWVDEVLAIDPGVNLYLGNGWTSTTTSYQHRGEFWAGCPLYPFLVSGWIRAFGFSPLGVRSLGYFLMLMSAACIWLSVVRLELVRSATGRVMLLAMFLMGYGISFCYRGARYDVVLIFLAGVSLLAFTIRSGRLRCSVLGALGFLYPLGGLQMVVYTAILTSILLAYLGRQFLREFLSINAGVALGIVSLTVMLWMNGVFDTFVASVFPNVKSGAMGSAVSVTKTFTHANKLPKDPSLMLLLLALWAIGYRWMREGRMAVRSVLSFGVAVSILVPAVLVAVAKFPTYYTWMAFIPMSICTMSALSSGVPSRGRSFVWSCIFVTCLMGAPLQLAVTYYDREDRNYSKVERLVENEVTRRDWVYTAFAGYYAAKQRGEMVFLPRYRWIMSPEEKKRLSVLIVNPANVDEVIATIGGKWQRKGYEIRPMTKSLWQRIFGSLPAMGLLDYKYHLSVWKRIG